MFGDRQIASHVGNLSLIYRHAINHCSNVKHLGVILNENLTFSSHCDVITVKCDDISNKLTRIQFNAWKVAYKERFTLHVGLIQALYERSAVVCINKRVPPSRFNKQRNFFFKKCFAP